MSTTLSRIHIVTFFALTSIFFFSRLILLNNLPLFIDEAIHIQFGRAALEGDLSSGAVLGKWLSIQIMGRFLVLPLDALMAARISTVLCGYITLFLIFMIGKELYCFELGFVAAILYIIIPFTLFYDRVALTDQYLLACNASIVLFSVKLTRRSYVRDQVALFILLPIAFLLKFSGIIFVIIPLMAIMNLMPRNQWYRGFLRVAPAILGIGVAFLIFAQNGFIPYDVLEKTGSTNLTAILSLAYKNLVSFAHLFWIMLTPPLFLVLLASLIWSIFKRDGGAERFLLFAVTIILVPYLIFAQTWYPRYLLSSLVPICILLGMFILHINTAIIEKYGRSFLKPYLFPAMVILLMILPITRDIQILTCPSKARFAPRIKEQYVTGWTSGYGLSEMVIFLKGEAIRGSHKGINIIRTEKWDQPLVGIDVFLSENKYIKKYTLMSSSSSFISDIISVLENGRKTYFVYNSACPYKGDDKLLEIVRKRFDVTEAWYHTKPEGRSGLKIWELNLKNVILER